MAKSNLLKSRTRGCFWVTKPSGCRRRMPRMRLMYINGLFDVILAYLCSTMNFLVLNREWMAIGEWDDSSSSDWKFVDHSQNFKPPFPYLPRHLKKRFPPGFYVFDVRHMCFWTVHESCLGSKLARSLHMQYVASKPGYVWIDMSCGQNKRRLL